MRNKYPFTEQVKRMIKRQLNEGLSSTYNISQLKPANSHKLMDMLNDYKIEYKFLKTGLLSMDDSSPNAQKIIKMFNLTKD